MYRPRDPAPPRKTYRAGDLQPEHAQRFITLGDPDWPIRGILVRCDSGPPGLVLIQLRRRSGKIQEIMTPETTPILVHRPRADGNPDDGH